MSVVEGKDVRYQTFVNVFLDVSLGDGFCIGGDVNHRFPSIATPARARIFEFLPFLSVGALSGILAQVKVSDSPKFDKSFHYRSIIGKLNYLEKASRPDIAYITHQCARFVEDPRKEHGEAVRWLARYLKGSRDKGVILKPKAGKQLEVHVDADFAGNWDAKEWRDPDTARSRHGYIISYAGCPLLWKSQLQTEHALSSTESEYTGLSYALRDAIPIMELMKEMIGLGYPIESSNSKVYCKVFEDNSGALEIAKNPKFRPRTKHLNNKLHHFRHYVDALKEITIHKIATEDQNGDYLTKPLNEVLHTKHQKSVQGW